MTETKSVIHKWGIGDSVVVNFGFGKGIMGTVKRQTSMYRWFCSGEDPEQPWGHEKLMPAYGVTFFSPQHNRNVSCTYEEKDLI